MPEEKKRFTVRRGGRVEIGIAGDADETRRPELPAAESRRVAAYADDEDEPLQRRRGLSVEVFDLGTRLRSVPAAAFDGRRVRLASELDAAEPAEGNFNEYVELELSRAAPVEVNNAPGGFARFNLSDAERDALGAELLGAPGDALDAFAESAANGSGRKVPNAMPLPFDNSLRVDVMLGDDRYPLANRSTFAASDLLLPGDGETVPEAARAAWRAREPKEEDASERWNPYNTGAQSVGETHAGTFYGFDSLNPAFGQGTLRPKGGAGKRLAIAHGFNVTPPTSSVGFGLYETFDTSDAETFKVTREPSYSADEVAFKMPAGRVRVYLKPRFVIHYSNLWNLNNFTRPLGDAFAFAGREPLYPFPPTPADLRILSAATLGAYMARTPAARETLQRLRALYAGAVSDPTPSGSHVVAEYSPANQISIYLHYSLAEMLVGVVTSGSARFYIWRRVHDAARFAATLTTPNVAVPELLPYL